MLGAAEEERLVAAWQVRGDREAARTLVLSHLRLVVRVVRDHSGYGLPEGDLAQEGTVGLMRAVHKFDPGVGVRLAAYALRWIEAEIREFIFRNWRLVRLGSASAMRRLFFGYRQTLAALNAAHADRPLGVSPQEVADAMGVAREHVETIRGYFGGRDLALDAPPSNGGPDPTEAWLLEGATGPMSPEHHAEEASSRTATALAVHEALAQLKPRDRAILTARRLQDPPVGLAELGQRWSVSAERIRQIEARAAQALEAHLRQAGAQALIA